MHEALEKPIDDFDSSRRAVYGLLEFDAAVIGLVLDLLRSFDERNKRAWETALRKTGHLAKDAEYKHQDRLSLASTIRTLENIRTHGSLKPQYEIIVNQSVVLLVSHFASAMRNLLHGGLEEAIQAGTSEAALKFEVRTRAGDLHGLDRPIHSFIADYIVAEVSFQDMQSIGRALRTYFDIDLARDVVVNNLIAAQAARNVFAHSGDLADARFMQQVRGAVPRTVLTEIAPGASLMVTPHDVRAAGEAMHTYLHRAAQSIDGSIANKSLHQ